MNEIIGRARGSITIYDPEKGLKKIAIAEAGEKHWARAKDATRLFKAIETKLVAQAEYVVWRGVVVMPSQKRGAPGRGKRVVAPRPVLPDADPGNDIAYRWRKSFCAKNGHGWEIDEEKLEEALNDARLRSVRICEQQNMSTVRGTEGTGEFERYTPPEYIEAAREVLGAIDLDPATSKQAQKWIKATKFFTAETDGLAREWHGRVWLNPPYHRELAPRFIDKLVEEFRAGRTTAAIMLTNNCTDTDWFLTALKVCASICFTHGRICFAVPNGGEVLPTQGQAFFYFGSDLDRFESVFCRTGFCLRPSREFQGG